MTRKGVFIVYGWGRGLTSSPGDSLLENGKYGGKGGHSSFVVARPIPIVLVKCWKVAHWNAKKLLKKFQKLLPKFLAIFI